MHKWNDETTKTTFEPLPDGQYPAVLTDCKLDLENQYGPRVNMTFTFPNRRKAWVDLRKNKDGKLSGAMNNVKRLGLEEIIKTACGDQFSTELFLKTSATEIEKLVGHYYIVQLKTFDGNGKQYASVFDKCVQKYYETFQMPTTAQLKANAEMEKAAPTLDSRDELNF